jgi:hypothetical protein
MAAEVCNIGVRGQQQRRRFGVLALAIGVGLAVALVLLEVDRPWRLVVFLPLLAGGTGVFQAREKT